MKMELSKIKEKMQLTSEPMIFFFTLPAVLVK